MQNLRKLLLGFLLLGCGIAANAQKLPNVQQVSVRAPATVKIDGKADKWNDKFQAYNHATEIYYTIANNDDHIYLLIRATKPEIINKVLLGGITFIVNSRREKNDKKSIAITYPTFYQNERPYINLKNKPTITKDTVTDIARADSFMRVINKDLVNKSKIIEVEGIKEITDSLVSIYNPEGIKAAALFNRQLYYTCELAVPLKYLNALINNTDKFSYHIKLNGTTANNAHAQLTPNGKFLLITRGNATLYAVSASPQYMSYTLATDFWGEYTLAKK